MAAFVRDGRGRLEKHEAVIGRGEVDPAGGNVIGEGPDVVHGIVAAEREFESVFSVLGAMAGAGITAQLCDDRVNVLGPGKGGVLFQAGDRYLDGSALAID